MTTQDEAALAGPFLTSEELKHLRQLAAIASQPLRDALRHIDAQAAVIATQNATMDDQQRRVRELEALQSELPRALRLYPLGEVMGRGVMADRVPLIAELLRAAQAEREARRG